MRGSPCRIANKPTSLLVCRPIEDQHSVFAASRMLVSFRLTSC